jgi:HD-GYP domain-containing protein (c-di-GMP phosphodiesterase class II)
VLNKPGRLSDEEYALIKEHPKIGQKILQSVEQLQLETQALAEHHEHFDGTGYPNGLKGEQISLIGRVVAVADLYDSLTTDRPYRKAMTSQEALDFLIQNSGSRYDPRCVQAMINLESKGGLNFDEHLPA